MPKTEPEDERSEPGKGLNLFDTVNIIVGIVIGTTIFALPWLIFDQTPNPWMGLGVWVFGGILALIGGLCYAELASTYPRAGGDYYYLTTAFGRWVGFLFGWAQLVVILPASIGVMAYVFASEATQLYKLDDFLNIGLNSEFYYAAVAVFGITLLNVIGVAFGKTIQNVLTIAKVVGLLGILVCGVIAAKPAATDWSLPAWGSGWGWQSLALILVLYAYGGWNDAAFVAAEVRNPQRNIPRALIYGIGSITVIYVLINLAYIVGLGFHEAQAFGPPHFRTPPTKLLLDVFGPNGEKVMRAIIMVSALGAVNGLIFAGSRVYAVLGNDHRLFGFIGHWSPNRGSPLLALVFQALITLLLVLIFGTPQGHAAINQFLDALNNMFTALAQNFDETASVRIEYSKEWKASDAFEALVSHSAPAFWIFFLLAGFSLFALRAKNPNKERPFSVPWYPLLPFIFCNMCVYMLYQSVLYIGWRSLFVVALLLLGVPLYWLSQALGGRRRDVDDADGLPVAKPIPSQARGGRRDVDRFPE